MSSGPQSLEGSPKFWQILPFTSRWRQLNHQDKQQVNRQEMRALLHRRNALLAELQQTESRMDAIETWTQAHCDRSEKALFSDPKFRLKHTIAYGSCKVSLMTSTEQRPQEQEWMEQANDSDQIRVMAYIKVEPKGTQD